MKKKQDSSVRASALHVALALALASIFVILVTSSFAQRPGFSAPSRAEGDSAALFQTINTYTGAPVGFGPVVVTATRGVIGPTTYPSLKAALDAINAGTHQGDIIIDIVSSTTEGSTPATLNGTGAGPALYTSVLIRPVNDGVSISGNPASGRGVVQLNGVSDVTIDGDNPNTPGTNKDLTIQNTATNTATYTSVIRMVLATNGNNHAHNDTIENLNLVGNATVTGTTDNALFALAVVPPVVSDQDLHIPTRTVTTLARGQAPGTGVLEDMRDSTPRPRPIPAPRPNASPHTSPAGSINGSNW
jgi:hypothetical protein